MVRVTVTSAGQNTSVTVVPPQTYYDNLSRKWAISDEIVEGEDYSSKHYAQESKKQADIATEQAQTTTTRVEEINTATTTALSNISAQETSSKNAVNAEGESQIANIQTNGNTQINNIKKQGNESVTSVNSAGTTQVNLAKAEVAKATEQAKIATNKANEVIKSGNNALNNIESKRSTAVADVEAKQSNAIASITELQTSAKSSITSGIADIKNAKAEAENSITDTKTNAEASITTAKNNAISAVTTTKTSSVTSIKSAQTTAESSIKTLQAETKNTLSTGLTNINDATTEAITAIQTQETNSKKAIEDKTQEALAQIPTIAEVANNDLSNLTEKGETKIKTIASTSATWGNIQGTLTNQTDLSNAIDKKQNKLTFDTTPIANSTNPVTSGGVKTALDSKANSSEVVKTTGNQTIAGIKTFSSTPVITSPALNINNTNDISLQKQGTNFIRKAKGGQLILSASNASIYLRPKSDVVTDKQVEIKTDGTVNATKFVGALQGNVTGNVTGSSGSCTGNAVTATKATQDGSGNNIVNTYATKASLNAKANSSLSNLTDAGKQVIKDNSNSWNPPLLQPFWTDHLLNRMDMLRSDTFSWQSGATYSSVYNELLSEYNNASSTTKTDTIGTVTITYKLTPKGYKICATNQVTNLTTLYNNTGIAWYYVLDTANKQFKLPRTKWGFKGLRDNVGNTIAESLPNITGTIGDWPSAYTTQRGTGAFTNNAATSGNYGYNTGGGTANSGTFNAHNSSSIYQDGAHVQEQGTQMYLYFYIGQYTPEAVEQTAGLNTELFNNKMDRDLSNRTSNIHFVTETYVNGTSGYRIWSDKYSEQWGDLAPNVANLTFLKPFANTDYTFTMYFDNANNQYAYASLAYYLASKAKTGITKNATGDPAHWKACGYIK